MKAEKIQKEQTPRTIQSMRKSGGTAQFVDNRNAVQLISSEDEEESLQLKKDSALQRKPNNTGLPDNLKTGVENLSGLSMDDVRVHYNSSKPATVQALAYTQGADIHVAPGQEQHLPHETWHVVQQMQGRVQPTTEVGGMPVNNDVGLEREADVMGTRITQFKEVNTPKTYTSTPSSVAQFITEEEKQERAYKIWETRRKDNPNYHAPLADYYDAEKELNIEYEDDVRKRAYFIWKKKHDKDSNYNNPLADYYEAEQDKKLEEDKKWCFDILEIPDSERSRLNVKIVRPGEDRYEETEKLGGGAFDHTTSEILICSGSYNKRTLLHEMGHFKQLSKLKKASYENLSPLFREAHNIIVNENKDLSLSPPANLENVYVKIRKNGQIFYRRIGYRKTSALPFGKDEKNIEDLIEEDLRGKQYHMSMEMYKEIKKIEQEEKGPLLSTTIKNPPLMIIRKSLLGFLYSALIEQIKENKDIEEEQWVDIHKLYEPSL